MKTMTKMAAVVLGMMALVGCGSADNAPGGEGSGTWTGSGSDHAETSAPKAPTPAVTPTTPAPCVTSAPAPKPSASAPPAPVPAPTVTTPAPEPLPPPVLPPTNPTSQQSAWGDDALFAWCDLMYDCSSSAPFNIPEFASTYECVDHFGATHWACADPESASACNHYLVAIFQRISSFNEECQPWDDSFVPTICDACAPVSVQAWRP